MVHCNSETSWPGYEDEVSNLAVKEIIYILVCVAFSGKRFSTQVKQYFNDSGEGQRSIINVRDLSLK